MPLERSLLTLTSLTELLAHDNQYPYTLHATRYTLHPTLYTPHPSLYTLHLTPYTLHPTSCNSHSTPSRPSPRSLSSSPTTTSIPTLYPLHPTPCTLHPTPYTLYPTPYTLHPTPYTLHPTPYTLHPTPYKPPPTPYTLQPTIPTRYSSVAEPSKPLIIKTRGRFTALPKELGFLHNLFFLWSPQGGRDNRKPSKAELNASRQFKPLIKKLGAGSQRCRRSWGSCTISCCWTSPSTISNWSHPTPYTLHPTSHTLHPTPCTLHPSLCALHPTRRWGP